MLPSTRFKSRTVKFLNEKNLFFWFGSTSMSFFFLSQILFKYKKLIQNKERLKYSAAGKMAISRIKKKVFSLFRNTWRARFVHEPSSYTRNVLKFQYFRDSTFYTLFGSGSKHFFFFKYYLYKFFFFGLKSWNKLKLRFNRPLIYDNKSFHGSFLVTIKNSNVSDSIPYLLNTFVNDNPSLLNTEDSFIDETVTNLKFKRFQPHYLVDEYFENDFEDKLRAYKSIKRMFTRFPVFMNPSTSYEDNTGMTKNTTNWLRVKISRVSVKVRSYYGFSDSFKWFLRFFSQTNLKKIDIKDSENQRHIRNGKHVGFEDWNEHTSRSYSEILSELIFRHKPVKQVDPDPFFVDFTSENPKKNNYVESLFGFFNAFLSIDGSKPKPSSVSKLVKPSNMWDKCLSRWAFFFLLENTCLYLSDLLLFTWKDKMCNRISKKPDIQFCFFFLNLFKAGQGKMKGSFLTVFSHIVDYRKFYSSDYWFMHSHMFLKWFYWNEHFAQFNNLNSDDPESNQLDPSSMIFGNFSLSGQLKLPSMYRSLVKTLRRFRVVGDYRGRQTPAMKNYNLSRISSIGFGLSLLGSWIGSNSFFLYLKKRFIKIFKFFFLKNYLLHHKSSYAGEYSLKLILYTYIVRAFKITILSYPQIVYRNSRVFSLTGFKLVWSNLRRKLSPFVRFSGVSYFSYYFLGKWIKEYSDRQLVFSDDYGVYAVHRGGVLLKSNLWLSNAYIYRMLYRWAEWLKARPYFQKKKKKEKLKWLYERFFLNSSMNSDFFRTFSTQYCYLHSSPKWQFGIIPSFWYLNEKTEFVEKKPKMVTLNEKKQYIYQYGRLFGSFYLKKMMFKFFYSSFLDYYTRLTDPSRLKMSFVTVFFKTSRKVKMIHFLRKRLYFNSVFLPKFLVSYKEISYRIKHASILKNLLNDAYYLKPAFGFRHFKLLLSGLCQNF